MTGIMDCALTNGKHPNLASRLDMFRRIAVDTNEFYAKRLGINKAAAVTAEAVRNVSNCATRRRGSTLDTLTTTSAQSGVTRRIH